MAGLEPTLRAGARGLVAAMAMTGVRRVTTNVRSVGDPPPEAIVERHAPRSVMNVRPEHREMATELAHWAYGTVGGAAFGLLPIGLRVRWWAGPVYGLGIWLFFELGLAPMLDVQYSEERRWAGRVAIALDHVLYGVVVAGRLAPAPEVVERERRTRR